MQAIIFSDQIIIRGTIPADAPALKAGGFRWDPINKEWAGPASATIPSSCEGISTWAELPDEAVAAIAKDASGILNPRANGYALSEIAARLRLAGAAKATINNRRIVAVWGEAAGGRAAVALDFASGKVESAIDGAPTADIAVAAEAQAERWRAAIAADIPILRDGYREVAGAYQVPAS